MEVIVKLRNGQTQRLSVHDIYLEHGDICFETEKGTIRFRFDDVTELDVPGVPIFGAPTYPKLSELRFLLKYL